MFKNSLNTFTTSDTGGVAYRCMITGYFEASGNIQSLVNFKKDAPYCAFKSMFEEYCSGLLKAPRLPATTLGARCYEKMFKGCTHLTQAPVLPATVINTFSYSSIFNDCSSLTSINVNFTNWSKFNDSLYNTHYWVNNVAPTGEFHCPAGLDTTTRDFSHVPNNWTIVNK